LARSDEESFRQRKPPPPAAPCGIAFLHGPVFSCAGRGQHWSFLPDFQEKQEKKTVKSGKIDKKILIQFFNVKTVDIKENP
jgi:hypothetical protein